MTNSPMQTILARLSAENRKFHCTLCKIKEIASEAPELNMANYDESQVEELNNSMIQISMLLAQLEEFERSHHGHG